MGKRIRSKKNWFIWELTQKGMPRDEAEWHWRTRHRDYWIALGMAMIWCAPFYLVWIVSTLLR